MKLTTSTNDQCMAMAAHRYCLGRATYIVGCCHEWLRHTWKDFEPNTRNVMVRDTIEAFCRDCVGHECDARGWWAFVEWAWPRLDDAGRLWVVGALKHLEPQWPERFRTLGVPQTSTTVMSSAHGTRLGHCLSHDGQDERTSHED